MAGNSKLPDAHKLIAELRDDLDLRPIHEVEGAEVGLQIGLLPGHEDVQQHAVFHVADDGIWSGSQTRVAA